jgi:hypothetical protein
MTTETVRNETVAATQRTTEQLRQFGDRATETGRAFSQLALDTYEQAVSNFIQLEHKAAEAVPFEWVKAAIDAHASYVEGLSAAYVKAARAVLN